MKVPNTSFKLYVYRIHKDTRSKGWPICRILCHPFCDYHHHQRPIREEEYSLSPRNWVLFLPGRPVVVVAVSTVRVTYNLANGPPYIAVVIWEIETSLSWWNAKNDQGEKWQSRVPYQIFSILYKYLMCKFKMNSALHVIHWLEMPDNIIRQPNRLALRVSLAMWVACWTRVLMALVISFPPH